MIVASRERMQASSARESPASTGYRPGRVVSDRYQLLSLIAEGGMGCVWRAHDQLLDADVALKLMFPSRGTDPEVATKRARSEARLAARLRHPAVCSALDFGISELGDPYIVSELLEGEALDTTLELSGRLAAVQAAQLMLPILDGLCAAHAQGIVHRDIKPSNIFLARTPNGRIQPKLLDFGIARCNGDARVTITGAVCGTPDYMSPEQARGCRDVDARSDVWSVCASLYELVTGRVPFPGENYNAVMFAVIQGRYAPLHELPPEDAELGTIIELGLRKSLDERVQTAQQLAEHLTRFLLSRGASTDASGGALSCRAESGSDSASDITLLSAPFPLAVEKAAARQAPTRRRQSRVASSHRKRAFAVLAAACVMLLGFGAVALAPRQSSSPALISTPEAMAGSPSPSAASFRAEAPAIATAPVARVGTPRMLPPSPPRASSRPLHHSTTTNSLPAADPAASVAQVAVAPPPIPEQRLSGPKATSVRPQNALGYDFGL
jgi:serine/threonine-protein kinase